MRKHRIDNYRTFTYEETPTGRPLLFVNSETLNDWSRLNRDCAGIFQCVVAGWRDMLAADLPEQRYQKFLSDHAGFFFGESGIELVIEQFQLSSELRPDFIVARDFRSGGLNYEFIELKCPDHSPFTKEGLPSKELNKAMQQIRGYKSWLDDNRDFTRKFLPAKDHAGESCSFRIVIGNRANSREWLDRRNQLAKESRLPLQICSYDHLLDDLMARVFRSSCPEHWFHATPSIHNQMANPFYRAFSDKEWRKLMRQLESSSSEGMLPFEQHFLASAGKFVLQARSHNDLLKAFLDRQDSPSQRI